MKNPSQESHRNRLNDNVIGNFNSAKFMFFIALEIIRLIMYTRLPIANLNLLNRECGTALTQMK